MLFIFTRLWSVIKPNVEEGIIVISLLKYYTFSGAEDIDEEWWRFPSPGILFSSDMLFDCYAERNMYPSLSQFHK